jgi:outer membrane protein OmpA-like peptidoglycan-associated protein
MAFKRGKKSHWEYDTSAGDSLSVWIFLVEGGSLFLKSPSGATMEFVYQAIGGGASIGAPGGFSSSDYDMWSDGAIYLSETFGWPDLSVKDIEGFCLTSEVSVGAMAGGTFTAMLLGIPATSIPAELLRGGGVGTLSQLAVDHPNIARVLAGPIGGLIFDKARTSLEENLRTAAKAVLLSAGRNSGAQLGGGVAQTLGYVRFSRVVSNPVVPDPPGPHRLTITPVPGKGLRIHIPGDLLFGFDKWDLKPKAIEALAQVKTFIRESQARKDEFRVSVEGYTDSIGPLHYNVALSLRRAETVKRWLVSEGVVKEPDVTTHGWGPMNEVKPNKKPNGRDNPEGRAANRRVEVWILYQLVNLEP